MEDIIKKDQEPEKEVETPKKEQIETPEKETVVEDNKKVETIKIGDRDVPLSEVQEWETDSKNKTDWQKSNTEKAQKIAEDGKALERYKAMAQFVDDPVNKEKTEAIQKIVDGVEAELPPEDEFEDEAVKALRAENAEMKQAIKDINEKMSSKGQDDMVKDIEREEKAVRETHKDLTDSDIDTIYSIAKGNDGASLIETADKYVEMLKGKSEASIKAYLDGKEEDGKKFLEGGGSPPTPKTGKTSLSDGTARNEFAASLEANKT